MSDKAGNILPFTTILTLADALIVNRGDDGATPAAGNPRRVTLQTVAATIAVYLATATLAPAAALTTSQPFTLQPTVNDAGVAFTVFRINLIDSASAAATLLADFQVGGVRKLSIGKDGAIVNTAANGNPALFVDRANSNGAGLIYENGSNAGFNPAVAVIGSSNNVRGMIDNQGAWYSSANFIMSGAFAGSVDASGNVTISNFGFDMPVADAALTFAYFGSDQALAVGIKAFNSVDPSRLIQGYDQNNKFIFNVTGDTGRINWGVGATLASMDTSLDRTAAGVLAVGNGTSGNASGTIKAGSFKSAGDNIYLLDDGNNQIKLGLNTLIAWCAGSAGSTGDLYLQRDAANTLALRNGTAAQSCNIYETFTDASNYSRLAITTGGSVFDIFATQAGSGTARGLRLYTVGATSLSLGTNFTIRWLMDSNGHFITAVDNTYDIGASGATRPRNVYVGTTLDVGNGININSAIAIGTNGDGIMLLRNNGGGALFNRLLLGGTSNAFPSLKRSAAALTVRLADDSADADINASHTITSAVDFLHKTTAALNNGAGAGAGTITNAPAAGNPTKWVPISDNGTTRYVPAW